MCTTSLAIALRASKRVSHLQPRIDLDGVLIIAVNGGKTTSNAPLKSLRELFASVFTAVQ